VVRELKNQVESQLIPLLEQVQPEYIQDSAGSAKRFLNDALTGIEQTPVIAERTQRRIATRMANSAETFNRNRFINDINQAVGVSLRGVIKKEGVATQVNASIETNIGLIKSIPEQYHGKLRRIINEGIERGDDAFSLRQQINELGQVTERRARFIARDQTAKLNSAITEARQTRVGVTHYFWRTSMDERVRPSHLDKEGVRFAWDSPPADTGHPGQDFNCRCSAEPDLSGLLDTVRPPRNVLATAAKVVAIGEVARRLGRRSEERAIGDEE
jgi:SPP1 gp7 family putative phage head morphogenesis protein